MLKKAAKKDVTKKTVVKATTAPKLPKIEVFCKDCGKVSKISGPLCSCGSKRISHVQKLMDLVSTLSNGVEIPVKEFKAASPNVRTALTILMNRCYRSSK